MAVRRSVIASALGVSAVLALLLVIVILSLAESAGSAPTGAAYGLIQAQHPRCQTGGNALASYLDTGQPTTNDDAYGNQRQLALTLSGEQRSLYIRRVADEYIRKCDQQEFAREAAQAQAQAQAQADQQAAVQAQAQAQADQQAAVQAQAQAQADQQAAARAQAHAAEVLAKEKAACARVGGQWESEALGGGCGIDYKAANQSRTYHYVVFFDDAGDIAPQPGSTRDDCLSRGVPVVHWQWHPDTMICSP